MLDRGDGVRSQPTCRRPRLGVERRVDPADRAGVLADERGPEAVNDPGQSPAAALVELRPADETRVSRDLEKGIGVPTPVGVQVLELHDLHGVPRGLAFGRATRADKPNETVSWFARKPPTTEHFPQKSLPRTYMRRPMSGLPGFTRDR